MTDFSPNDDAKNVLPDRELDTPIGEAYVQFSDNTSYAFRTLVRETLEESDWIETEFVGEQLVVSEVDER